MSTTKPRVIPISDDGELGKIMPGEAFVEQYFPELQPVKKPDATTDPIRPAPVPDPPAITPPAVIIEPAPKKPFGWPRVTVGTLTDKGRLFPVCLGHSLDYLLLVVNKADEPDAFMPCGFNLGYQLQTEMARPTGQETPWGVGQPATFNRPDGYRLRYFEDGARYYEQSDLPDEEEPRKPGAAVAAMNIQVKGHYS
jgi:hypothetical protein